MQIGLSEIIAIISLMGSAIAFARTIPPQPGRRDKSTEARHLKLRIDKRGNRNNQRDNRQNQRPHHATSNGFV